MTTRAGSGLARRPLVLRTAGSATEGVYGLILALAVIAVSREYEPVDAGRAALSVLVVAIVFWLATVYARVLGSAVSREGSFGRGDVSRAMRHHWSLVEVAIPLVLVLGLGGVGLLPDRAAILAATLLGLFELAATGAYAARVQGAGPAGTALSAAVAVGLGVIVVVLKALVH